MFRYLNENMTTEEKIEDIKKKKNSNGLSEDEKYSVWNDKYIG